MHRGQGPGNDLRRVRQGLPGGGDGHIVKNSSGTVVDTTHTIQDGSFEFTGVPNDTYTVTSKFAKVTCAEAAE